MFKKWEFPMFSISNEFTNTRARRRPESAFSAAENKAEIIVGKQRHGPTGTINLHFEKRFTYFSDLTDPSTLPDGY